ncbi:unnamed protein product [Peniophora sp. CBMAI 1063]|nr:unnamed protein product [Peniophora sp. CBMAI 1063]
MPPYPTPPPSSDSLLACAPEVVIFSIDEDLTAPTSSQSSVDTTPSSSASSSSSRKHRLSHPRHQTASTSSSPSATASASSSASSASSSRTRRAVRFAVPASADKKHRRRLASPEPARERIALPMAHMLDSLESLSVSASSCEAECTGADVYSGADVGGREERGRGLRYPSPSSSVTNSAGSCESVTVREERAVVGDEMSERHARRWARRAAPY